MNGTGMATGEGARPGGPTSARKGLRARLRRAFGLDRLLGLTLLTVLVTVYVVDPGPVETLRLKLFDLYQNLQPREVTVRPVTIVDIDEASLGEYGQWPWPRTLLARLVRTLIDQGAVVVAFDVMFAEADRMNPAAVAGTLQGLDAQTRRLLLRLPSNDEVFAETIAGRNVVLARAHVGEENTTKVDVPLRQTIVVRRTADALAPEQVVSEKAAKLLRNVPAIEAAASGHGFISLSAESDGIVRRVPAVIYHDGNLYPTLALEMLRVALQRRAVIAEMNAGGVVQIRVTKDVSVPTDGHGQMWPYFSKHDPRKYVSVRDVLEGKADPALIEGKLVVAGTSAFGLRDIRAIPTERSVPGVEVHAQVIENALTGTFLNRPNFLLAAELALILVGGLLMVWLVPRIGAKWTLVLFAVVAGGAAASAWFLFTQHRVLFDVGYPIVAMLLLYTLLTYMGYTSEEANRRRVRAAFSYYLAPAMVEKLAEDPAQLKLGGETRTMTMLFCDVRGFTTISETFKGNPEGLTALINKLLTPLTQIILEHRGTVDKYMGDCIMAFWNAPLDDPLHARNACLAALDMQAAMGPLNERLSAEAAAEGRNYHPLAIGVGINTGAVVVGNMGSDQRFDYSVLGDDVNLASRLEGQSKSYQVGIVVGENTHAATPDLAFLELDLIRVKGKREAVRIFTVIGDSDVRSGNAYPVLEASHTRMLDAYRGQRWTEARGHLETCRELVDGFGIAGLYDVYEGRIADYEQAPPPPDWDGVYVATSK